MIDPRGFNKCVCVCVFCGFCLLLRSFMKFRMESLTAGLQSLQFIDRRGWKERACVHFIYFARMSDSLGVSDKQVGM